KRILRPELPNVPSAFCTKASVLNHCLTGSTPAGRVGSPATSARFEPASVSELSRPLAIENGGPDWRITAPLTAQPSKRVLARPESDVIPGRFHIQDVTKRWLRWKSERPRL